ncbi:MAG: family 20 glycosylhydrolase [Verrucomicrobiota bacterium]|nr:family 20 glycosylhydrolase [Verrucomicrobiota bacterium]
MASDLQSFLFPTPSKLNYQEGFFKVPQPLKVHFQDHSHDSLLSITPLALIKSEEDSANLLFVHREIGHREAFKIIIGEKRITVFTSTKKASLFALHQLKQMLDFSQNEIPCCEIHERPILDRRGFMLDVSRCKVPTMETIFELIDLLSLLRFNELQLYIEHTFAFSAHKTVWQNFSPFTGAEIEEIDTYCKDREIELVPNLNSFGHFERWLRHEPYKKLAECPDGFVRNEPYMIRDHGSVLKPGLESLEFIDSLYEEYLPHYSSSKFNVGLDEPWELGQGFSKKKVEKIGKHRVYLEHLKGILSLVEKRGKSMEFWADVLLEKPENANYLPSSASPIIWGYEADHPFDEQAEVVASSGLEYTLAPGTATWRSFTGRWETARKNITSACANALKHNAKGILLTSWGDCGNHQPWTTIYPPLFLGGQFAWSGKEASDETIGAAVDREVFGMASYGLGKALIDLAQLDKKTDFNIPNNSLPWFALFSDQPEKLPQNLSEQTTPELLKEGLNWLMQLDEINFQFENESKVQIAVQEWKLGIKLSITGIRQAICLMEPYDNSEKKEEDHSNLLGKFREVWLLRARKGGLQEAVDLLEKSLRKTYYH